MVVRPRWPGEDTTPSASRDDASDAAAYSSADEASQPWPGLTHLLLHCRAIGETSMCTFDLWQSVQAGQFRKFWENAVEGKG